MIEQAKLGHDPSFLVHADNSSSLRSLEERTVFNAVRIGLLQFGIASPRGSLLGGLQVEPVLSFLKLAMIKELPKDLTQLRQAIHLETEFENRIIRPRLRRCHPSSLRKSVLRTDSGQSFPLVGRVTMDQTLIDLTDSDREFQLGEKLPGRDQATGKSCFRLFEEAKTIPGSSSAR